MSCPDGSLVRRGATGDPRLWRLGLPGGRLALILGLLSLATLGVGQERFTFSGLTITARGDQELDLATGITTLPDGGEIVAAEQGVTIVAEKLSFLQDQFVEAAGATARTEFGSARAESLRIDLVTGNISASGAVSFQHELLTLNATGIEYFATPNVLVLVGPVVGEGLEVEAASVLLDVATETVLLVSPYRYVDGIIELRASQEGRLLSLRPVGESGTELQASSEVDREVLERMEPYLP